MIAVQPVVALPFITDSAAAWTAALWFAVAIGFLDRFEISLPRGDSIGVSGALVAAGILIVGPIPMSTLAVAALLVAHLGRTGANSGRFAGTLIPRVAALVAAGSLVAVAGSSLPAAWYFVLAAAVASAYLFAELAVTQGYTAFGSNRRFSRLLSGNLVRQAPLLAAQVSVAVLTDITYRGGMNQWSLLPVVALLLLMRQSYALLLEMRETYRTTVEVLVEAAEGQDQRRRGHAERTAAVTRAIAMRAGLRAHDVERASYTALLHDIDAIAETDQTRLTAADHAVGHSSEVFREADFFSDVLPLLRICDGVPDARDTSDANLLVAMIVALASDVDVAAVPEVARAHDASAVSRVAPHVPGHIKARAVGAALELGYEIPAVP